MGKNHFWLKCPQCGHRFPYKGLVTACPRCSHAWLDVEYDYDALAPRLRQLLESRPFTSMWRYRELLPVLYDENIVTMGEGGTPLLHSQHLGMMLGHPYIYVKDERQGPTGSFKDRQASLAISLMKENEITEGVLASTGNVAISYSAYSALAGIKLWAFVTSTVPADKMREVALYGTEVIKVTATYDQTKEVAARFAQHKGLFLDRGIRAFASRQSMKTIAYEIAEQLGWRAPDWYIQAVSGGLGPVGVWQGFEELYRMGLIPNLPKLANIQVTGCAPMVRSFRKGLAEVEPVLNPQTLIATVATGNPGPAYPFLRRVVLEHGGTFEEVTDEEAFRAMRVMARMEGLSMEPAAAMAFAGLFKLIQKGIIRKDEIVVVNCSGHTFPVEKHLLDEEWVHSLELSEEAVTEPEPSVLKEEGLLASLERLDDRVRSVAIIDDEPDAVRLLRRIIQAKGGYQIYEAYDGHQGLRLIREKRPDLVLLDLMMPGMDGFAVLTAMKEDPQIATIPVIVITAKDLTSQERRWLSGKVESLLQKGSYMDLDALDALVGELSTAVG